MTVRPCSTMITTQRFHLEAAVALTLLLRPSANHTLHCLMMMMMIRLMTMTHTAWRDDDDCNDYISSSRHVIVITLSYNHCYDCETLFYPHVYCILHLYHPRITINHNHGDPRFTQKYNSVKNYFGKCLRSMIQGLSSGLH